MELAEEEIESISLEEGESKEQENTENAPYFGDNDTEESLGVVYKKGPLVLRGKTYKQHPLSAFYKVYPQHAELRTSASAYKRNKDKPPVQEDEVVTAHVEEQKPGGILMDISFKPGPVVERDPSIYRFLSQKRWNCSVRPQFKYGCGIATVVGTWNYLYSTDGTGELEPITQEDALHILGYEPPFDEIRFGSTTGNKTLMDWFHKLNSHFNVNGSSFYAWKPVGINTTHGKTPEIAREELMMGLQSEDTAYIYHCYNHYIIPIGFEETCISRKDHEYQAWIMLADSSKTNAPILSTKFEWIAMDLLSEPPYLVNIRHTELGLLEKTTKPPPPKEFEVPDPLPSIKKLHCIIGFCKT